MTNEADWKILEGSYGKFILDYAQLAQELKLEIFCIGTELENFVSNRPIYWAQLVKDVRAVYKGKLTYAANWNEFGNKVRAISKNQYEHDKELWEQAHTATVIEEGQDTLTCEFRDKTTEDIQISHCWPLANTENRYSYLRRRYPGLKGEQVTKKMEMTGR